MAQVGLKGMYNAEGASPPRRLTDPVTSDRRLAEGATPASPLPFIALSPFLFHALEKVEGARTGRKNEKGCARATLSL